MSSNFVLFGNQDVKFNRVKTLVWPACSATLIRQMKLVWPNFGKPILAKKGEWFKRN